MKKFIALISVITLSCSLFSCENKKSDSELPETEELTTETVPETSEPVFREFKDEVFRAIDMNLNIIDDNSPIELNSADISGVDFGELLAPCKGTELADKYLPRQELDDPEQQEIYDAERERFLSTPSKGTIDSILRMGDKFYFKVNYDDFCYRHAAALFSFDPESGETKKVDERIGLEYNGCYNSLTAVGDKFFFIEVVQDESEVTPPYVSVQYYDDDPEFKVYRLDPAAGETIEFADCKFRLSRIVEDDGKLLITGWNNIGEDTLTVLRLYDPETGEVISDDAENIEVPDWFYGDCDGVPVEVTGGFDEETSERIPVTIKTQYYSIDTGMYTIGQVFAWKDRVSFTAEEGSFSANEYRLYTYDLSTMERTKMKINGFSGEMRKYGDGIIDAVHTSVMSNRDYIPQCQIYYILPDIGTAYRVEKIECDDFNNLDDMLIMTAYKHVETEHGTYFYSFGQTRVPDKIYWISDDK